MEANSTNPELSKFPNAEQANAEAKQLPSAFDLFKASKAAITFNLTAFLVIVGLPMLLTSLSDMPVSRETQASLNIFVMIGGLLSLLFGPGAVILQLKSVRKETIAYGEAISQGLKQFWRFLGLVLLTTLILAVALLLLIVPFFIVLPRIVLAPYYLIDQKMGIVESLKASNAAYKTHKGIWGVLGVIVLLALTTIIPLIGWIISTVLLFIYSVAFGLRYEQMQLIEHDKKPITPIEASLTVTPAA